VLDSQARRDNGDPQVGYLVVRTQRRTATTGFAGLVGETGVVREWMDTSGKILGHGEYWDAVSDERLGVGERVDVVRAGRGMRPRVQRAAGP